MSELSRRETPQRVALRGALDGVTGFLSAQDIHARLSATGAKVGLATVYRHLHALAAEGEIDTLRTDDGETVYRACATSGHHHHLVCRRCGRTVEVEASPVERWTSRVADDFGFVDVEHQLELFGTCLSCRQD